MNFKFFFTFVIITLTKVVFSQNSSIKGKVIDEKTGETLPGAMVVVEGTTMGANTDFDGLFSISNLPPGKYALNCKLISYNTKILTDVLVKEGESTIVSITMGSASTDLGIVEITATMSKETNNSMLVMQKNNASVSDGISSESIKKTPDRNTGDVIKRISGATIQDNKFAVIRGMNDRYNTAYINGAPLPSSESDRRAFSFDIFPSNLLDNLVILKTATPDLPGDFAGGVIQINTKSIPEKNSQYVSFSSAYNTITTFKPFKTYEGGKYDWLGMDDGVRQLNSEMPGTLEFKNSLTPTSVATLNKQAEYGKLMYSNWGLKKINAAPAIGLQYTLANVGKVLKREAGSIFSVTYNNTNSTSFSTRREFEEQPVDIMKTREFHDTSYSNNILSSVLWNLAYKLNDRHQLSLKNLYSINTDDKVTVRKGLADASGPEWEKSNLRWFTQNNIYTGQLGGDHLLLPKYKLKFKWLGALSSIRRDIPNMRKMAYRKVVSQETDTAVPYEAAVYPNITTGSGGTMFFSTNKEEIQSAKYDFSLPFEIKKTKHELKLGGFHQLRDRNFNARFFGYTQYKVGTSSVKFDNTLLQLPEEELFTPEHMGKMDKQGPKNGGFKLSEATTPLDSYIASSRLHAGFLMLDSKIMDRFRFIYGLRFESYQQEITNYDQITGDPVTRDTTFNDFLPSINAVYALNEKMNLRAAYYKTVSRPEFRELAKFNFYDFIMDFSVSGNPNLNQASIDNYDLRYEWFPGAGQLFSASVFYKEIKNAIEQIAAGASQIRSLSYANVKRVQNMGAELEYRFKLSTLFNKASSVFFNNTTLYTNLAYIKSKVDLSNVIGATERPMQGQSPYIVNAGIQYMDTEKGYAASISYNVIGRRIFIVGSDDEPDYWENSRHIIDLQLSKTFLKEKLEIKFNARDILAQPIILYQDINNNNKYDKISESANKDGLVRSRGTDNIMMNTKVGSSYSLGVSFKF